MFKRSLIVFVCAILALSGCKKRDNTPPPPKNQAQSAPAATESGTPSFDTCALITKQEIESIEGSPLTDTKNSGRSDAGLSFTQCFYTTAEFSRSVSLAVIQADPRATPKRNVKEVWEQTFGHVGDAEKEGEKGSEADREKRESLRKQKGEREEEEHAVPPRKIDGIGEEAFWSATRVGGALYVLKKNAYVRVSVGGPDPEDKKIDKCKALAEKALGRL